MKRSSLCISIIAVFLCSLPVLSPAGEAKVTLTGDDMMQFNTKAFTVTSGDLVVLTFKHIGKLPKEAMGHNVVILNPGVDVDKFAQEAMVVPAKGFIPPGREGDIIAMTKMIGGGEETEIKFQAPEKGEYTFICTFPGHYVLMRGIMTVK